MTQFDFFVAALKFYWNSNHDGLGPASKTFWHRSASRLSGLDLGGGPSLSIPGIRELEARDEVTRGHPDYEIRGDSGWKSYYVDNDNSPARHVWGFLASTKVWGVAAAKYALADNESPGKPGASLQDQRSGDAAILIGGMMDLFDVESFALLETLLRTEFYDPNATRDQRPAPLPAEHRNKYWEAINPF